MSNFFVTSLKSIKQTGTISPSSKYLINKIIKNINFKKGQTIVEFGTGNGCITETLLARMQQNSKLYSFELNDNFWSYSENKFRHENRINIYNINALYFDQISNLSRSNSIDYFISSLPLTLLKDKEIETLMKKVKAKLKPGGKFIQYQYSLGKFSYLKNEFNEVRLSYALRNIPPAFIYSCKKAL